MTRAVPEWIADHDDQAVPRSVKARIWLKQDGRCAITGRKLTPADKPEFDHIKALIDGGEHRESNLQLIGGEKHKEKSAAEAKRRAKERDIHAKHFGYATPPARKIPAHVDPWGKRRKASQSIADKREGGSISRRATNNPRTS